MPYRLQYEIERLKKSILTLGAFVEEQLYNAVKAVAERDRETALSVVSKDGEIDSMEVDLEEDCLKILALHQPVAVDLRFIISILKMNSDLERIGDYAVNIAKRAASLAELPEIPVPFDFPGMAARVKSMMKNSLDALVNMDSELANSVCREDDRVDEINKNMFKQVEDDIRQNIGHLEILLQYHSISRYLERTADLVTNIAEDVIYMAEGRIIRHQFSSDDKI